VIITLYLKTPDVEIDVAVDEPAPKGTRAWSEQELWHVLNNDPSPSEFRVIESARRIFGGRVLVDGEKQEQLLRSYGEDTEFLDM
jgi:hypothetical protein